MIRTDICYNSHSIEIGRKSSSNFFIIIITVVIRQALVSALLNDMLTCFVI